MTLSDTDRAPLGLPGASHYAGSPVEASGKGALMVFLGTLGVAATALLILMAVAPVRFGLVRGRQEAPGVEAGSLEGGQDPSGDSSRDPVQRTATDGSGPSTSPDWEALEVSDVSWTVGQVNPAEFTGSGYGTGDMGAGAIWSASGRPFLARDLNEDTSPLEPRSAVPREPAPPTLAERIFADASPSVVLVAGLSDRPGKFNDVSFVAGTGSGLVWDREGHIVTSRHIIEHVKGANITLSDGSSWAAKLINVNYELDIAVLQIKPRGVALTPIRVGTSHDLNVGMTAFSVACPYALRDSLTRGLISGLNRNIQTTGGLQLGGMIQTDAPMHPGSSGGALIDDQGRVVGMNTAVHLESGLTTGVGFAIPVDVLQQVVPRLIQSGMHWHEEFGFLTLSAERTQSTLSECEEFITRSKRGGGSPLSRPVVEREPELPSRGLVVSDVEADSGAAQIGLRRWVPLQANDGSRRIVPRDVVVGVAGEPVFDSLDLERAIAALGPEEPLKLDVWRNGIELSLIIQRTAVLRRADRPQER